MAGKVGLEPTTLALTVRCSAIELYAKNGRGDRIRTYDLLVPNQTLYQAKLHPENGTDGGNRTLIRQFWRLLHY